jgi:predicted ribosome quality control (RQC) complex YloA/Tae2 family protein
MKVSIDPKKSVYENASAYFEEAKKLRKKAEATAVAIENTKKELLEGEKKEEKRAETVRKTEWFEKFRWFISSEGFLAVGGKSAEQNMSLVAKHFMQDDLFFHADIRGGSVVILKNGISAGEKTLKEAAQFAASYSNAWEKGFAAADTFAAKKDQVSRSAPAGQFLPKGSFVITGEKKYFKGIPLGVVIGLTESGLQSAPRLTGIERFSTSFELIPGDRDKEDVARDISKEFGIEKERISGLIPAGRCAVKRIK